MFGPLADRNFTKIAELQLPLSFHQNLKWRSRQSNQTVKSFDSWETEEQPQAQYLRKDKLPMEFMDKFS